MKAEPSFTISDLAREFDVTTRTIRFYEDQGLLERFRRDFLATCPDAAAVCAREHENLRPIRDALGEGPALEELPVLR